MEREEEKKRVNKSENTIESAQRKEQVCVIGVSDECLITPMTFIPEVGVPLKSCAIRCDQSYRYPTITAIGF